MDGFDFDVDLAVLQSMYDAQGFDPQSDYVLDDFQTDVYEFLDEFSAFLYGSFGFDGDGEPEPCDAFGGDDEPCGTPPGPDDDPILDEIFSDGSIIRYVDVAAWSYTNAAYLINGGGGWSVRIDGGGFDVVIPETGTQVEEDEPYDSCQNSLDGQETMEPFLVWGERFISTNNVPGLIVGGWLGTFGGVGYGAASFGVHINCDGEGEIP